MIYKEKVFEVIDSNRDLFKDIDVLIIFIMIPLFYFIGHIVHGIDIFLFYLGRLIRELAEKTKLINPINLLINGHRVSTVLHQKKIGYSDFSKDCAKLRAQQLFSAAEYLYLLNDFFKGIYVISWIAIVVCLYPPTKAHVVSKINPG